MIESASAKLSRLSLVSRSAAATALNGCSGCSAARAATIASASGSPAHSSMISDTAAGSDAADRLPNLRTRNSRESPSVSYTHL